MTDELTDVYTRIFDIAHMDRDVLAQLAAENPAAPGFVFLKVSQGVGFADPSWPSRFDESLALGFVPLAYHYMTGQHSGRDQWAYFRGLYDLACQRAGIDGRARIVMVDHERTAAIPAKPSDTLAFCDAADADGYRPLVYFGQSKGMGDWPAGCPIGKYPGMQAAYGPDPRTERVPGAWASDPIGRVPVRQYSNGNGQGGAGPGDQVTFPRSPCDRSCYLGTEAQARSFFLGQF